MDEGPFIHHPVDPGDLRDLMRRLPREALDGLQAIELGLGLDLIRQEHEKDPPHRLDPDPYTGRDSSELFPGVYKADYWGSWGDGPWDAYQEQEGSIYLFAAVYADEPPHRTVWEFYLRLEVLLGFIHGLTRHREYRLRIEEGKADSDADRKRMEELEEEWMLEYVVPFLLETFPAEVQQLEAWTKEHGGLAVSLALPAGEPLPGWKAGSVSLAAGNFVATGALQDLIEDVLKANDPLKTRIHFARALHYVEFYSEALRILRDVLAESPGNVEAILLEADIYVHQEEFERARPLLLWALERQPADQDALQDLADVHEGTQEWPEVVEVTTRLLETTGPSILIRWSVLLLKRSRAFLEMGQIEKATTDLDTIVAHVPAKYPKKWFVYRRVEEMRDEIASRTQRAS